MFLLLPHMAKKAKDPNAPKRPLSAYFLFLQNARASIVAAMPAGSKVQDIARAGGERWAALSADERRPFEDAAKAAKEKYAEAKKAYEEGRSNAAASNEASEGPDGKLKDVAKK